jgi:hypothetical protein
LAKSLEKYHVNNTTVRLKRLGNHRIEIVTSDRKKELQETLFKTIRNTGYTDDKTEHTERGNLICRLLPTTKMSFNKLIEKIVNLIVRGVERYEKKYKKEIVPTQSSHVVRHVKKRKRNPNYQKRIPVTT